jgi:hypothetical protein
MREKAAFRLFNARLKIVDFLRRIGHQGIAGTG